MKQSNWLRDTLENNIQEIIKYGWVEICIMTQKWLSDAMKPHWAIGIAWEKLLLRKSWDDFQDNYNIEILKVCHTWRSIYTAEREVYEKLCWVNELLTVPFIINRLRFYKQWIMELDKEVWNSSISHDKVKNNYLLFEALANASEFLKSKLK